MSYRHTILLFSLSFSSIFTAVQAAPVGFHSVVSELQIARDYCERLDNACSFIICGATSPADIVFLQKSAPKIEESANAVEAKLSEKLTVREGELGDADRQGREADRTVQRLKREIAQIKNEIEEIANASSEVIKLIDGLISDPTYGRVDLNDPTYSTANKLRDLRNRLVDSEQKLDLEEAKWKTHHSQTQSIILELKAIREVIGDLKERVHDFKVLVENLQVVQILRSEEGLVFHSDDSLIEFLEKANGGSLLRAFETHGAAFEVIFEGETARAGKTFPVKIMFNSKMGQFRNIPENQVELSISVDVESHDPQLSLTDLDKFLGKNMSLRSTVELGRGHPKRFHLQMPFNSHGVDALQAIKDGFKRGDVYSALSKVQIKIFKVHGQPNRAESLSGEKQESPDL